MMDDIKIREANLKRKNEALDKTLFEGQTVAEDAGDQEKVFMPLLLYTRPST